MILVVLSVLLPTAVLTPIQNEPLDTPVTVRGHVISDSNLPLPNVTVARYWWPAKGASTSPDAEGNFMIQTERRFDRSSGKVVLRFSSDGYRPKTRVVRLNSTNFAITLFKADDSLWNVPSCGSTATRLGLGAIGYTLPATVRTKHYGGDALTEMIQFGKFTMGHSWGLN